MGEILSIIHSNVLLELILTSGQKSVKSQESSLPRKCKLTFASAYNCCEKVIPTSLFFVRNKRDRPPSGTCLWPKQKAALLKRNWQSHNHISHRMVNSISSKTQAKENYQRGKGSFKGLSFHSLLLLNIIIIFKYFHTS